jgi:hypothetical protein
MPEGPPQNLYEEDEIIKLAFPKYFSFVADPRGQGGTGITRIHVKKRHPKTNELIDQLYEVHIVGNIISSSERGMTVSNNGFSLTAPGRLLLSTGDNVIVRFTEDLAKLRDSDTYEDSDPYFTSFPVYGLMDMIPEPEKSRPDFKKAQGQIFQFKGRINVAARVEGLAPPTSSISARAKQNKKDLNQDLEPVSYVARISYSEDAININDKILLFIPTDPGPEKYLDPPYVEPAGTYASPGK